MREGADARKWQYGGRGQATPFLWRLLTGPPFLSILSICDTQMEKPYQAVHSYRGSPLTQSHLTGHGQRELSCGRSWDELFVGEGCLTYPGIIRESTQPFTPLCWAGVSTTHQLAAPGSSGVHHCPHPLICWPSLLVLSSLPCCWDSFSREPGLLEQALKAYDKYWKNKTKSSPNSKEREKHPIANQFFFF